MITIIPESVTGGDTFIGYYNKIEYQFKARWIEAPVSINNYWEEVSRSRLYDLIHHQKLTIIPWYSYPSPDTNLHTIYSDWLLMGYDIQLKMMELGLVKFRYSLLSEIDNFSNPELSKMVRFLKLQNLCKSRIVGLWKDYI